MFQEDGHILSSDSALCSQLKARLVETRSRADTEQQRSLVSVRDDLLHVTCILHSLNVGMYGVEFRIATNTA